MGAKRSTGILALALGLGAAVLISAADPARAELERFFGTYVGVAQVFDFEADTRLRRDMDIVIEPHGREGLRLHWINVTLVDGERAVPGVERHVQTVLFEPSSWGDFLVEVSEGNPFKEREQTRPMRGDPVRWAKVDDDRLHVYSFVVLDDGRYEMQVYDRVLTEKGLDILFQRIVDGEVVKEIVGTTARANAGTGDG